MLMIIHHEATLLGASCNQQKKPKAYLITAGAETTEMNREWGTFDKNLEKSPFKLK